MRMRRRLRRVLFVKSGECGHGSTRLLGAAGKGRVQLSAEVEEVGLVLKGKQTGSFSLAQSAETLPGSLFVLFPRE